MLPYPALANDVQINRLHASAVCLEMGERLAVALGPLSIKLHPPLLSLVNKLSEQEGSNPMPGFAGGHNDADI
jgi:hypothetical protein